VAVVVDVVVVAEVAAAVFREVVGGVCPAVAVAIAAAEAVIEVADIVARHPCRARHRAHPRSTVQAAVADTRVLGPAMAICQHREVGLAAVRALVVSPAAGRAVGRGRVISRAVALVQDDRVPERGQVSFLQAAIYKTSSTFQRLGVLVPVVLRRVPVEVMAELWLAVHSRAARPQSS